METFCFVCPLFFSVSMSANFTTNWNRLKFNLMVTLLQITLNISHDTVNIKLNITCFNCVFTDLSRRTIFYDIVDYLYNQRMSPQLQLEIPVLVQRPVSQEIKRQHIRVISELR